MAEKKKFVLRMDEDLWDALQAWAGADLRSVNGQIEYLLRQAVKQRGKKAEPESPPSDSSSQP